MEGRLRLREPQITPIEGGFLVSDPYGVYEKPLALTEGGLFLLSLMEGRTLEEVQEEVFKRHGVLVPKKELEDLAKALEEAGLLLTEKVEARLKEEEEKLKRERPMRLAGLSYPEGEREARAFSSSPWTSPTWGPASGTPPSPAPWRRRRGGGTWASWKGSRKGSRRPPSPSWGPTPPA